VNEGGEGLDVGAHDDDVAGLEGGVVGQEVEDGVAHHLHLAGPTVAGMHLQAAVAGFEDGPLILLAGEGGAGRVAVGPHVGLDTGQERHLRWFVRGEGTVVVAHGPAAGGEDQLHPRRPAAGWRAGWP
jgi:hypothetical protein